MVTPIGNVILLTISTLFAFAMVLEGILLITTHKLITPIPSRILVTIGNGILGREKSSQYFSGRNTLKTQRTYAVFALGFGALILIACAINLNLLLNS